MVDLHFSYSLQLKASIRYTFICHNGFVNRSMESDECMYHFSELHVDLLNITGKSFYKEIYINSLEKVYISDYVSQVITKTIY